MHRGHPHRTSRAKVVQTRDTGVFHTGSTLRKTLQQRQTQIRVSRLSRVEHSTPESLWQEGWSRSEPKAGVFGLFHTVGIVVGQLDLTWYRLGKIQGTLYFCHLDDIAGAVVFVLL